MDPLGRCLTICIIFTVFCAFFSFSASVLSAIRIPDESEEEDEEPLSLKLYRKRNACRYRLACSAVFCALAASVCVSYAFAEKLERALPDTASSVSYTHLDVYKRQSLARLKFSVIISLAYP